MAPKVKIPKRTPSVVIPKRQIIYITPDKTTCVECDCFPKESPYCKNPKLNPCLISPLTLYELASAVLDKIALPKALSWSVHRAARWMAKIVGLPQYTDCILNNNIDGMRLLLLEDPSRLPDLNIHDFEHIKMIVTQVRILYSTEFIYFARSIGLPPRKPGTHCTWFQSKTRPNWSLKKYWTRSDILRWMKIIGPKPIRLDHWDLVWYQKPDFPKTLFARIPRFTEFGKIPHYVVPIEICNEYLTPRKFRLNDKRPEDQLIWMEHRPGSPSWHEPIQEPKIVEKKVIIEKRSRLEPKKICLEGLSGKNLILARRLMPKQKFLVK